MRGRVAVVTVALFVQGTLTTGCALVSGNRTHNAASAAVSVGAVVAGSIIASNPHTCGGSSCEFTGAGLIVLGTIGALVFIPALFACDERTADGRSSPSVPDLPLEEHPPMSSSSLLTFAPSRPCSTRDDGPRVCSSRTSGSVELAMGGVEWQRNEP
jgi:hypothetical protein